MKFMRKTAFCLAFAVTAGALAFPAAAADDVAAQIKAASGEKYSVDTKALGFTALEGVNSDGPDTEFSYSCSATPNGYALIEDKRCLQPAGRATGKAIIFDMNGNQLIWADLGDSIDKVYYSVDSGILSVTRGFMVKADLVGKSEINAEYASINSQEQMKYTTGTRMLNRVAAVLEDTGVPNSESVGGFEEGSGAHRLSLINEKGEKILTLSEPIELAGYAGGGADVWYYGCNYNMDFGDYAEGLLPFNCDRQLGETLNDLTLNTGADKDGWSSHESADGYTYLDKSNKYVFSEHEAGYANLTGRIVIPQKFDEVSSFCEGLAWVGITDSETNQKKYGFIDKTGNYVIEPQFEGVGSFQEGMAPVMKDGKWGYIDTTGKFVIAPQYDDWYGFGTQGFTHYIGADIFSDGVAQVATKTGEEPAKYGFINKKGETILPLEYDGAFGSDGTYFTVGKTDGDTVKYGIVDKDGNTVLPFIFEDVTAPVDGVAYAFYNRALYRFVMSKANLGTGDFDGDETISVEDAQSVLNIYAKTLTGAEVPLTDAQIKAADINGDGTVDVADAQLILLYYVKNTLANTPTDWKDLIQ